MLCEKCQKRPATVHMTKIQGGSKTETNLCEVCAQEENFMGFGFEPKGMLQNIFAELFNQAIGGNQQRDMAGAGQVTCEQCGFTDAQFSNAGKVGCPKCYDAFEEKLDPVLRRIHGGNSRHTGKIPLRTGEALSLRRQIEGLKQQLQEYVNREEYEKAAEIRDQIRGLEGQVS